MCDTELALMKYELMGKRKEINEKAVYHLSSTEQKVELLLDTLEELIAVLDRMNPEEDN